MAVRSIHATAVTVRGRGILLRGPSRSGKSALALDLLAWGERRGVHAMLVADDRVLLERREGRILARPPDNLAGLIEVRGTGVVRVPHEPVAAIDLVVDLAGGFACSDYVQIEGVTLPRLASASREDALYLISTSFDLNGGLSPCLTLAHGAHDGKYTHP